LAKANRFYFANRPINGTAMNFSFSYCRWR